MDEALEATKKKKITQKDQTAVLWTIWETVTRKDAVHNNL